MEKKWTLFKYGMKKLIENIKMFFHIMANNAKYQYKIHFK